jgi:hypothetical protein
MSWLRTVLVLATAWSVHCCLATSKGTVVSGLWTHRPLVTIDGECAAHPMTQARTIDRQHATKTRFCIGSPISPTGSNVQAHRTLKGRSRRTARGTQSDAPWTTAAKI